MLWLNLFEERTESLKKSRHKPRGQCKEFSTFDVGQAQGNSFPNENFGVSSAPAQTVCKGTSAK